VKLYITLSIEKDKMQQGTYWCQWKDNVKLNVKKVNRLVVCRLDLSALK
jgi:hypothetical protein